MALTRSKSLKAKKFGTSTTPTTTTPKAPSPRATGGTPTATTTGTPTKPTSTRGVLPQSAAGIAIQEKFKRDLQQILHAPLSIFSSPRTQALEKAYGDERRADNKERLKEELDKERQELKNVELASNVNQIIGVLESGGQLYPDWFNNNIVWVKTGQITSEEFLTTYYYLSNQGTIHAPITEPIIEEPIIEEPIIEEPIIELPELLPEAIAEPEINDSINTNMVTQQVINFNIVNGRAIGSIRFVATNNFNPYYYGKNILSVVQFKTPNGVNILPYVKQNNLRFTETERDEIINFDEDMKGNTRATVESFVWEWIDKPAGAFSNKYSIEISETETAKPLSTGIMGAGVGGAIGILILLGFIADSRRKK